MPIDGLSPLSEWTFETVKEVVRTREFEPARFDYKEVLVPERGDNKRRDEHRSSIRKTACAMANGQGGLILFGIKDRKVATESPESRIVGIPLDRDLTKEFGDQMRHIDPEVHFQVTPAPIRLPDDATKGVFVVGLEESLLRPHMVLPDHIFYRRGDGGQNNQMKQNEVRDQMLYGEERRRKTNLLRMRMISVDHVANQLHLMDDNHLEKTFVRMDLDGLESLLSDVCGLLREENAIHVIVSTIARAKHVNRILDYAVTPNQYDHQGLPAVEMREEIRRFLKQIINGSRQTLGILSSVLGDEFVTTSDV